MDKKGQEWTWEGHTGNFISCAGAWIMEVAVRLQENHVGRIDLKCGKVTGANACFVTVLPIILPKKIKSPKAMNLSKIAKANKNDFWKPYCSHVYSNSQRGI